MKLGNYLAAALIASSATTAFAGGESTAMEVAIASDACNGGVITSAEFLPNGEVGVTCAEEVAAKGSLNGAGAGVVIGGLVLGALLLGGGDDSNSSSSGTN